MSLFPVPFFTDTQAAFEGMTFAVDVQIPEGKQTQVPLKPGGEEIPLTLANRSEFVDLYTRYLLVQSVQHQVTLT